MSYKWDIDPKEIEFPVFLELYNEQRGFQTSRPQLLMAEWLQDTDEDPSRILQAYRESGKSEVTSLWVPWKLVRDPNWTVIISSATNKIASRNSRFIRQVINSFWLAEHLKPSDPEQWQVETFTVERTLISTTPSVACTSITAASTGLHAFTFLGDDIEVEENVHTEEAREYLWSRVSSMAAICNQKLYIGTPHDEDTIYEKLLGLEFHDYKVFRIPSDDGQGETIGTPANPDVPINGYIQDENWIRMKMAEKSWGWFQAQYRLKPTKVYETLFNLDLIEVYGAEDDQRAGVTARDNTLSRILDLPPATYLIEGQELRDFIAYWDPAYGREGRDDSVLAIAASTSKGDIYVPWLQKLSPVGINQSFTEQCEEVLAACHMFGLDRVVVEKNFSAALSGVLRDVVRKKGRRLRVREAHRDSTQNKERLIADTLDPLIRTQKLYVHHNAWHNTPFKAQLRSFPKGKHDDFLDALTGAILELKVPKAKLGELIDLEKPFSKGPTVTKVNTWQPLDR